MKASRKNNIKTVRFNDDKISINVRNKGIINIPYNYTERLASCDIHSLKRNFRLIAKGRGIHFNNIDEDISLSGILRDFSVENRAISSKKIKTAKKFKRF